MALRRRCYQLYDFSLLERWRVGRGGWGGRKQKIYKKENIMTRLYWLLRRNTVGDTLVCFFPRGWSGGKFTTQMGIGKPSCRRIITRDSVEVQRVGK